MWKFLTIFSKSFFYQDHCYLWQSSLLPLHIVSDSLIALAYYIILAMLIYLIQQRRDLPFHRTLLLFSAFTLACGTTHLLQVWTLLQPDYGLSVVMKALTAIVSIYTSIALLSLVPKLLALPSITQLATTNDKLQTEIAERQQAEAKIRFQARLLELVEQAVIAMDLDGIITYWNRFAQKLYGWSLDEVVGCSIIDYAVAPHSREQIAEIISYLRSGSSWYGEISLMRRDHTTFTALVSCAPIFEPHGVVSGIVGSAVDITERAQAHVALEQANEALEICVEKRTSALLELNQQLKAEIEERQRAAVALSESEAKFRSIVENANDIIYLLSLDCVFDYVSPNWTDLLGHDLKEVEGHLFTPFVHPDDLPTCLDFFQKAIKTGSKQAGVEYRVKHKDGSWRWHTSNASVLKEANGNVKYFAGIARDITERKQAEHALRESEERFRQLAENINQVFWVATPDLSQKLYVSPAYEQIWGKSCSSLYSQPSSWMDEIHPEDRKHVMTAIERQNQTPIDDEFRIVRPDGVVRWIRERTFPVKDSSGSVSRIVGIAEDITERKRAEEEVRFLQSMKQAIFESVDFHAALGVALQRVCEATSWDFGEAWIPRPDGTVLECSPAWYGRVDSLVICKGLARFRNISEGMTFPSGVGLPGRVWASKRPEWRRDVSVESNQIYLRASLAVECGLRAALGIPLIANNCVVAVLVFYMFEPHNEDKRLIELISSATELGLFIQRKQAEEEIRKALEKEKELGFLKSQLVTTISHEYRTPLTVILGASEMLRQYGYKLSEEKKQKQISRIQEAVKQMTILLDNILTFGKAEAGQLSFNPTLLSVKAFCLDLIEEQQLLAGSDYTLNFTYQGKFTTAYLDGQLLRHILTNLLTNAIKYSPRGSTVSLTACCEDSQVIFSVQDQGIGIPPSEQQRLFESFFRASNVGNISGTGMGLAIVKKCVDQHGGQITASSQVGVGTTFTVRLPNPHPHNNWVNHAAQQDANGRTAKYQRDRLL